MALKYSDTDSAGSDASESLSSERHANGSELTGSVGELEGSGDGVTSVDGGGVTLVDGGSVTSVDGGGVTLVDRGSVTSVDRGAVTLVDRGSVTSVDRGGVTLVEMALNGEVDGSGRGASSLEVTLVFVAFIFSTSSRPW